MRAIAEYTILAAPATAHKCATFYQDSSIRQYYTHMSSYAQRATLYHLYLYLRHDVYYILFHILQYFFLQ